MLMKEEKTLTRQTTKWSVSYHAKAARTTTTE